MLILESIQNTLGVCYRQGNVLKARRDTKKKRVVGGTGFFIICCKCEIEKQEDDLARKKKGLFGYHFCD